MKWLDLLFKFVQASSVGVVLSELGVATSQKTLMQYEHANTIIIPHDIIVWLRCWK